MLLGDGTTSVVHSGAGATEVDDATDDRLFDLTDGLGSVRAQSDDTGAVTGAADYDVWGAELTSTTSSLFSWTGEQNDDETGLTYLRDRDDVRSSPAVSMPDRTTWHMGCIEAQQDVICAHPEGATHGTFRWPGNGSAWIDEPQAMPRRRR